MLNSILLVDHDETTSAILKQKFQLKGYNVNQLSNSQNVIQYIRQHNPECIILEVGLPDIDGIELCKIIKPYTDSPIVFHTSCNNDRDEIRALQAGADDYVAKSKRFEVLLKRIQRLIVNTSHKQEEFRLGLFNLNKANFHCSYNDKKIPLSSDEFELLHFFLKHNNTLIGREELFRSLKNKEYDGKSRSFDTCIFRLQNKLKNANINENLFTCVRGKGYILDIDKLTHADAATV
ncbi:response regulator transcription factor [Thalassotalea atypica]|uniref:response regulator transcription factor n=1 Tax=Thalassotalea atypica TaxID=2054316 RepID=UPI0025747627|nr:response regulator transcription factor [Thalassotalea atypica]